MRFEKGSVSIFELFYIFFYVTNVSLDQLACGCLKVTRWDRASSFSRRRSELFFHNHSLKVRAVLWVSHPEPTIEAEAWNKCLENSAMGKRSNMLFLYVFNLKFVYTEDNFLELVFSSSFTWVQRIKLEFNWTASNFICWAILLFLPSLPSSLPTSLPPSLPSFCLSLFFFPVRVSYSPDWVQTTM